VALDLGRIGIWTFALDLAPVGRAQEAVAELEELGYAAVWIPEAVGREAMANAALLLSGSERIRVATGIANIWARDAMAMAAGHRTLTSAFPDRFLLGIGVSHQPAVERLRGHEYRRPLATMRAYLDAMDDAVFLAAPPETEPLRLLGALGPRMLALAAERTAGAHPYLVPVEHTRFARDVLGPEPLLCPEQAVVLEADPASARRIGRRHLDTYLGLPNYTNNLRRFGLTEEDLAGGGSDRLVDAIVAWGPTEAVVGRVRDHLDAGADHVCIQVLDPDARALPLAGWRELAAALDLRPAP
jgi:probable F420-dependent oxidoreductase